MVRVDKVAKYFGGRVLFENVSVPMEPGARIGLVGANGSGKTTLFRMLAGDLEPDEGRIIRPKGTTLGHLPQDVGDIGELPLVDFVLEGRGDLMAFRRRMVELTEELGSGTLTDDETMTAAEEMGEISHQLETLGGYDLESRAESILAGMGFRIDQLRDPASTLSGGWRVRLVLCRLLLQRPDLLLLDEPTNHLDVPSVEWLEGFLTGYAGTVIVISHDRYFLNRLCTSIAAIEVGGFHMQPGSYDDYESGLAERAESLQKAKAKQDREIAQLERFVERFKAKASKAKQAQSRAKRLDKIERIETMETRRKVRRFAFAEAPREGKEVITIKKARKAYGDNVVYDELDFTMFRGERVALVGPNGQGKSTLLKLIVGETEPDAGTIEPGHNLMPAYFGQHQIEELNLSNTLLQEMEGYAPVDEVPRCRGILGAFLFSGSDVDKKISVLSGGEKNRLALAKLLLRPTNFLVLDEPTNHLDMESRETLVDALDEFSGTIVFVSHDRYFINALADRVVHVQDGEARNYGGNYDFYRRKRAEELKQQAPEPKPTSSAAAEDPNAKKERRRREAELRKKLQSKTDKPKKELNKLEKEIAEIERRNAEISNKLADPEFFASAPNDEVAELTREFQRLSKRLEPAMERWAELSEKIESIETSIRAEIDANR